MSQLTLNAERHFKSAQKNFRKTNSSSVEEEIQLLQEGLNKLTEGLISLMKQNGSLTSLTLVNALLIEKSVLALTHRKLNN